MKYLIISDIHGCYRSLDRALNYFEQLKCDKLIILGDILYHGPRNPIPDGYAPQLVFERLNSMKDKIIAVRGNCDAEVDQMVLDFDCSKDYRVVLNGEDLIFLTHGHIFNPQVLPGMQDYHIFMYGHTHIYELRKHNDIIILNPGSITLPKGGNPPTFAVCDGDNISIRSLDQGEELLSMHNA